MSQKDNPSSEDFSSLPFSTKIQELTDFLASRSDQNLQSDHGADFLTQSTLAKNLFARASTDFLEKHTLKDLVSITEHCTDALAQLRIGDNQVVVKASAGTDHATLIITLSDRPFIINTIVECIRESAIQINVLLHPVLFSGPSRVSLSYLELGALSAEALSVLTSHIQIALETLVPVTDDFSAMLARAESLARIIAAPDQPSSFSSVEKREASDLLRWLCDGSFVFLGHREINVAQDNRRASAKLSEAAGLFRSNWKDLIETQAEVQLDLEILTGRNDLLSVSKLNILSPVHRHVRMLHIAVQEASADGQTVRLHSFLGLLTSKAISQESNGIPVIRRKLKSFLDNEANVQSAHDYKHIVNIVNRMPKEDLLRLSEQDLLVFLRSILSLHNTNETKIALSLDEAQRGALVLVAMPRDRFNTHSRLAIQRFVEEAFMSSPGSSEYHLDFSRSGVASFFFYVPVSKLNQPEIDLERFKIEIEKLSRSWKDNLYHHLLKHAARGNAEELWLKYGAAFSDHYQATSSIQQCLGDLDMLEMLSPARPLVINSEEQQGETTEFFLTIYQREQQVTVSQAVPVLENAGLIVVSEDTTLVEPRNAPHAFIQRFRVRADDQSLPLKQVKAALNNGLSNIFLGQSENDLLNGLIIAGGLDIRAISLLRAYASLLGQLATVGTKRTVCKALVASPQAAKLLWAIFNVAFDPNSSHTMEQRSTEIAALEQEYKLLLRSLKSIASDRILRALLALVRHTLRTNFYLHHTAIAIKLHSQLIEWMPQPRPLYEIFISAPAYEAVHLRSGKVARGGIRWSDRRDDFRSEVLGLMKTQKIKNAVIVPTGAKGGFVLTKPPTDQQQLKAAVESVYADYIRTLLSITDNRRGQELLHPKNVICFDDFDPYFVVAADKGTATFSDLANKIARDEYDFWLGDAFASGGSQGYDHKLYGVTARGAWECAKRHFHDMGIDYVSESISVVGIGDMSGDVFGNGLLLSKQFKLIAAFDHRHIFLDPTPDPGSSFAERKRLFEKPFSKWSDYDQNKLSPGGGVFGRFDNEIHISSEARATLALPEDAPAVLNGEQLVSYILRAPCQLLWNGGIGTYVKSRFETQAEVGDGTNDQVRINADELRAKVVAEGGNLGFTQRARLEFARLGGRINTDAIDNSAGVDTSDHEVNLKILFSGLMAEGKISLEERNRILKEIAPEVIEAVLSHNKSHAFLLSLGTTRSSNKIEYFRSLIGEICRRGYVSRELERLPEDEEIAALARKREGLSRPALAVCLAAVKMWTKDELLKSNLLSDPQLQRYLLEYFPRALRERFREEILNHPLAAEITATEVTNALIDAVGISFLHRMSVTSSSTYVNVIKDALAANLIIRADQVRSSVDRFDNFRENKIRFEAIQDLARAHRYSTAWIMGYHNGSMRLSDLSKMYADCYQKLVNNAADVLQGSDLEFYLAQRSHYDAIELESFSAASLALYPLMTLMLEVTWTAVHSGAELKLVYSQVKTVLEELGLARLLRRERSITVNGRWEHELLVTAFQEIRNIISKLSLSLLKKGHVARNAIRDALLGTGRYDHLISTIDAIPEGTLDLSSLAVLARRLEAFYVGFDEGAQQK